VTVNVRLLCAAAALLGALIGGARAAEFAVQASSSNAWVFVRGRISPGDGAALQKLLGDTPNVSMVVLESNGGSLRGGQEIGSVIRAQGLPTLVRDGVSCAGGCADAWIGGTQRYLAPTARVFFHEAFGRDWRAAPLQTRAEIDASGAYFARMGLSATAIAFMTTAAPSRTTWFGPSDAKTFGFDVLAYNGTPAPPASTPTVMESVEADPGPRRMDQAAGDFLTTFFAQAGERPEIALEYLRASYADTVTYNGAPLPRAKVLEQWRAHSDRWPEQAYNLRPRSMTVRCVAGTALCEVTATADWEWSSWGRGARASGSTQFWFQLSMEGATPSIRAETQTELSRTETGAQ
jgi:hypothetical protein